VINQGMLLVIEILVLIGLLSVEPGRVCAPQPLMRYWLERAGFEPGAVVSAKADAQGLLLYRNRAPPHEVWLVSGTRDGGGRWCVIARGGRPA
jgi:hypothetical protein